MDKTEKHICVEQRDSNSAKAYFNHPGDWRPRLIVWPEYNGLCKDEFDLVCEDEAAWDGMDKAWASIIAEALEAFMRRHALRLAAFRHESPRKRSIWRRLFPRYAWPLWKRDERHYANAEYVRYREQWCHDTVVFLLHAEGIVLPDQFCASMLDRTNLLPRGTAIFELGTEEAVLEMCFNNHADSFLDLLTEISGTHDHPLVWPEKHWLSHWIIANHGDLGEDWDRF